MRCLWWWAWWWWSRSTCWPCSGWREVEPGTWHSEQECEHGDCREKDCRDHPRPWWSKTRMQDGSSLRSLFSTAWSCWCRTPSSCCAWTGSTSSRPRPPSCLTKTLYWIFSQSRCSLTPAWGRGGWRWPRPSPGGWWWRLWLAGWVRGEYLLEYFCWTCGHSGPG